MGDILPACLLHPGCRWVTFWGFTDRHSWIHRHYGKDQPLLFDEDYGPKPAFFATHSALALAPRVPSRR
jgi:GH35 family endo-1,4-beta-xylanase